MADPRGALDDTITQFLAQKRTQLETGSTEAAPLLEVLTRFLRGGKRLRPLFMYWGVRAGGVTPELRADDPWIKACASLEWLHTCALIHDDVMDASDLRRGQPSVHRQMRQKHEEQQWRADAQRFGESAAILLGDMCLIWCDEMLMTSSLAPDALTRARTQYDAMRTELMLGQYLDIAGEAMDATSVERAVTVLRLKSGRYTVQRPLMIGASAARADAATLAALSVYGERLGEAFQLRDDVLGVFGDPELTGKPSGDDVREGKRSVLMLTALQRASAGEAAKLDQHLGNPELTPEDLDEARDILQHSGALDKIEERIEQSVNEACEQLRVIPDPDVRTTLGELADAASKRSA